MALQLGIPQAIFSATPSDCSPLARSADFPDQWFGPAQTVCQRYANRPDGSAPCPNALFALPFHRKFVAVVQVCELATTARGQTAPLYFRWLLLHRELYAALDGDLFFVDAKFPPRWLDRGELAPLEWPMEPPPVRQVAEVRDLLKTGDSALFLGATQALFDGGRVVLFEPLPENGNDPVRAIWKLLPYRTRQELSVATFAYNTDLPFQLLRLPAPIEPWPIGILSDEQARDYPEGRYELSLQSAAETENQRELNHLLAQRSSRDTLRLAAGLIIVAMGVAMISKLIP